MLKKFFTKSKRGDIADRTLALAGVLQAAELIHEMATSGNYNWQAFNTSIESIYQLDASNTLAVYGNSTKNLELGLSTLEKLTTQDKTTLKKQSLIYFFGMLGFERSLRSRNDLMEKLRTHIEKVIAQTSYFQNTTHTTVLSNLADAYGEAMKHFKFRLLIKGNQQYLGQQDIMDKVRALLLAGIRSAVLWYQLGGNRWQLIFQRKEYLKAAKKLLNEA